jgi:cytoskeletal protein RodZ
MTTEQNVTVGFVDLKTSRENLGLTLKESFERTRISVVNLEAIEKGEFQLLPATIYSRNFIKIYSDFLGVDAKPVLQRYENYLQALQVKEEEQIQSQPSHESLLIMLGRYKTQYWIAGIILVVAALSFWVSTQNKPLPETTVNTEVVREAVFGQMETPVAAKQDRFLIDLDPPKPDDFIRINPLINEQTQTQPQPEAPSEQNVNATKPSDLPKIIINNKAPAIDQQEQLALIVHATEETWIRMQMDDKEPFEALLRPGEEVSYKAAGFNVNIGNAGGVRLQFDGKTIENLGKSGQVVHLRLP